MDFKNLFTQKNQGLLEQIIVLANQLELDQEFMDALKEQWFNRKFDDEKEGVHYRLAMIVNYALKNQARGKILIFNRIVSWLSQSLSKQPAPVITIPELENGINQVDY
ncbi:MULTISPECIES: hypothetical protein [Sphingobacterium]|uniref:hypothetical protein n=1 Tax=Sphingobacterium TaxID=28453 RepID=UPI00259130F0|nr:MULTISPECIES: hypothetical protein [Sphingobacterium]